MDEIFGRSPDLSNGKSFGMDQRKKMWVGTGDRHNRSKGRGSIARYYYGPKDGSLDLPRVWAFSRTSVLANPMTPNGSSTKLQNLSR